MALLFGHSVPHAGALLGFGELLVDVFSPRAFLLGLPAAGPVEFQVPIMNSPALLSITIHSQALLLGNGMPTLCNALRSTAGN